MMNKKRFSILAIGRFLPGVLMVVALLCPFSGFSQMVHDSQTVIESFLTPNAHAKPMARMWFPDASAGEDDDAEVPFLAWERVCSMRLYPELTITAF